jgi:hypothetical protein
MCTFLSSVMGSTCHVHLIPSYLTTLMIYDGQCKLWPNVTAETSAAASFSGGLSLKPRIGDLYRGWGPSIKYWVCTSNLATDTSFHILLNASLSYHPIIRISIAWAIGNVFKYTISKLKTIFCFLLLLISVLCLQIFIFWGVKFGFSK